MDSKCDSDDSNYSLVAFFCYIFGEYKTADKRKSRTNFVRKAYYTYFGMKLEDQDKPWATYVVCKSWVKSLRQWTKGTRKPMGFGKSMVWREPPNHVDDCYFYSIDVTGVNKKKRKSLNYQDFPSTIRPVAHSDDVSLSEFKLFDLFIDEHLDEEPYDHKELTDGGNNYDEDATFHAT